MREWESIQSQTHRLTKVAQRTGPVAKPAAAKPKKVARQSARQAVVLEAGQIWKAGESYIQIKEAGARLVHYKMAKTLHRPGLRKHMASVKTVRAYLKSQRAELITRLSSN